MEAGKLARLHFLSPLAQPPTPLITLVLLTYPRSAVDAVAPVAVAGAVVIRAVEELCLNDADGLPGEVVGHVPDEREHQYYDAKSVDRTHDTRYWRQLYDASLTHMYM